MLSVCMATFNGEAFLREQLLSVLAQLGPGDEVVISDDASTDGTCALVKALGDGRIRLLENSARLGPIFNLERALALARGEVVFLSDQDDLWLEGKVGACLEALKTADLVLHDAFILKGGTREPETLFERRKVARGFGRNILKNSYSGCCMAFRRELLEVALPFPRQIPMHDQWLALVAERKFRTAFLRVPFIDYRVHGGNVTRTGENRGFGLLQKLSRRLGLVCALRSRGLL